MSSSGVQLSNNCVQDSFGRVVLGISCCVTVRNKTLKTRANEKHRLEAVQIAKSSSLPIMTHTLKSGWPPKMKHSPTTSLSDSKSGCASYASRRRCLMLMRRSGLQLGTHRPKQNLKGTMVSRSSRDSSSLTRVKRTPSVKRLPVKMWSVFYFAFSDSLLFHWWNTYHEPSSSRRNLHPKTIISPDMSSIYPALTNSRKIMSNITTENLMHWG